MLELDTDEPRLSFDVGEGSAAGLAAINLDQDEQLEFIVAYGSRRGDRIKKALVIFATALGSVYGSMQMGGNYAYIVIVSPGVNVDVHHVAAIDDDGSLLWHRDLRAEAAAGQTWNNTRFKWVAGHPTGAGATILLTDDGRHELIGLSAQDGTTQWSQKLRGNTRPSKRQLRPLRDGDRLLPVLFSPGEMLVLDPVSGDAVLDTAVSGRVAALPSWQVFGTRDDKGFLAFGEGRGELRMISLTSGDVMWSHEMETVREVLPLADGKRFMVIWREGIKIFEASGKLIEDRPAPGKIKTHFSPIYRDLNDDGTMELVFVSGKKIICWRPETDEHLWTTSLGGFVGGANPVSLYDAFYDINGDGWLDVPGKKGSGAGKWLSGKTGEVLASVGNGGSHPIVGDFDRNGRPEVFWWKTWYEVVPAR